MYNNLPNPFPGIQINQKISVKTEPKRKGFKAVKAGNKGSKVVFILDDSSSMQLCRLPTIEGFNEYLKGQQLDSANIKTSASLYKFNGSRVNSVFEGADVNSVEPLTEQTYNPRGSTNLNDAIGDVIQKTDEQLRKNRKRDRESVIICILTDGEENSSRRFSNDAIKEMVAECEKKNWGFMFLGANIDAFDAGSAYGFGAHNTLQYSTANMAATMEVANAKTLRMKSAYASGHNTSTVYSTTAFTDDERKRSK